MRMMLRAGLIGLAVLVLAVMVMPAKALMVAPAPLADRVVNASTIIVGKVTAIEEKPVSAPRPGVAGGPAVEYKIAVIQVDEAILGAKGLTHIRVGFIPPQPVPLSPTNPNGGIVLRPPTRQYPSVQLAKDQEVCLFLTPLGKESFYVAPNYFDMIDKKTPNFDKEVAQVRKSVKLLSDPKAGLQSKDAQDRLTTASMLLARYRTVRGPVKGAPKTEPIDAEESKLILKAIAEADWNARPTTPFEPSAQTLFFRLGLTPKDGWTQPKNFKELPTAAKKWLADNTDKYCVQRYVPEAADK